MSASEKASRGTPSWPAVDSRLHSDLSFMSVMIRRPCYRHPRYGCTLPLDALQQIIFARACPGVVWPVSYAFRNRVGLERLARIGCAFGSKLQMSGRMVLRERIELSTSPLPRERSRVQSSLAAPSVPAFEACSRMRSLSGPAAPTRRHFLKRIKDRPNDARAGLAQR